MVVLRCPLCEYVTDDVDVVGASTTLEVHSILHKQAPAAPVVRSRVPRLDRPTLKANITCEEWNAFSRRWTTFRTGSDIGNEIASSQLLECATEDLQDIVLRAHPTFSTKPIDEATGLLKSLCVVPIALGVLRSQLSAMHQGADESFRTFAARVQGKAETCEYVTTYTGQCTNAECNQEYTGQTYYTDEMIRDVLLDGIADTDIRREALSVEGIQRCPVNDIIAFVGTRETARNANQPSSVSAATTRRHHQPANRSGPFISTPAEKAITATCPDCSKSFHIYSKSRSGWNKRPHERCAECWHIVNLRARGENSAIGVPE